MKVGAIEFLCCFCGEVIKGERWAVQVWQEGSEYNQQWWASPDCFKAALHESARHYANDGDIGDWEEAPA